MRAGRTAVSAIFVFRACVRSHAAFNSVLIQCIVVDDVPCQEQVKQNVYILSFDATCDDTQTQLGIIRVRASVFLIARRPNVI